ncbi:hypothetical protein [Nocardia wallacei]|uniref:hypothetical protein n=1 Tax=Nocardia wallacei TaxID=480035 RepID=UPI002455D610|nr:hypothetical protein [Nocardia wallacei]
MTNSGNPRRGNPRRRDKMPTPLAVIRNRFAKLADHPMAGLPPGWEQLTVGEVGRRLLGPQVPAAEVDAMWRQLVRRAQTREETAVLICAGAALPMLSTIALKLCGHWEFRADTESMVIVAFLDAIAGFDVERPNVANRLRWAVFHRTCPMVQERKRAPIPMRWAREHRDAPSTGEVVQSPAGHPEQLLQVAVDEGVITPAEAGLIAETRLDGRQLKKTGADASIGYSGLCRRRRKAEQRLAAWLRDRIADTAEFTEVETAALDNTARRDNTHRHESAARMSINGPETGVPPAKESATPPDQTSARKEVR